MLCALRRRAGRGSGTAGPIPGAGPRGRLFWSSRIRPYPDGDLREAVRRMVGARPRFVDPHDAPPEARARLAPQIGMLPALPGSPEAARPGRLNPVRQAAVFEHGCASAAADRVGPGVQGRRI
ncbi:hypothetical protein [Methylobacterium longum]|uniref:Uncharacterized protein n=1 Tax=Methylobacterium longum TaxID=767694 RepID=A0ABT8AM23_9HYPH|nr:hypothetical protein [Methylobacterium longum]MDN3570872.1 hypothetical protein [Methylobacterium longum]